MAEFESDTQKEIKRLLEYIAQAENKPNLNLPSISPEAAKQLAQQIKAMLRKTLH
ncbi:MAG: hypothetical protein IBX48_01990 [Thiomicrospira sp.]|uniref:hypothetical protein n=1 Tax=Thiomicrospira sp. TaxID=935 RepID=UPI0019DFAE7A|nr:hypothetical protein [Thiomicrospira sp.]MBE0493090.1 hypothetical protein [Thiomicrospira sp.]